MTRSADMLYRVLTIVGMSAAVLGLMQLFDAPVAGADHASAASNADHIAEMAKGWSGEIAYGAPYAALMPLSADEAVAADIRFDPTDDYWGLPRSDGVDLVAGYCGACHSLAIVMQQRQSAGGWNYLLNWMEEKQGMAPLASDDRAAILTYLTREFGEG